MEKSPDGVHRRQASLPLLDLETRLWLLPAWTGEQVPSQRLSELLSLRRGWSPSSVGLLRSPFYIQQPESFSWHLSSQVLFFFSLQRLHTPVRTQFKLSALMPMVLLAVALPQLPAPVLGLLLSPPAPAHRPAFFFPELAKHILTLQL